MPTSNGVIVYDMPMSFDMSSSISPSSHRLNTPLRRMLIWPETFPMRLSNPPAGPLYSSLYRVVFRLAMVLFNGPTVSVDSVSSYSGWVVAMYAYVFAFRVNDTVVNALTASFSVSVGVGLPDTVAIVRPSTSTVEPHVA